MRINKVINRILFLSPTVQAGWQPESFKSDFENMSTLGQGAYGVVWKARHKKTGAIYAIKQIKKKTINNQKILDHVRTEVKVMYRLNHPNIIKLYNHFEDEFSIYFVLQFAQKGELYKTLMKSADKKFSQQVSSRYVLQIVRAIKYIHQNNIIHRDIKPQNILISKDDELKLADFGWSNFTEDQNKRQTYCGTLDYLAPEMVDKAHLHDHRVDVWSVGVLIFELCTGLSPFSSQLLKTNSLSQANIKLNISKLNYKIPNELSSSCKDLISKILVSDPELRLSINEIMQHPWFGKTKQQEIQSKQKTILKLKHQFGLIMQNKQEQLKKYEAFSSEQIFNFSRVESVINATLKQKQGQLGERKHRQAELKIRQLQLCNKRQEEQLKYLKNIKIEHQSTLQQLQHQREINRQQTKKIQMMQSQLQQAQRKIKQIERTSNK